MTHLLVTNDFPPKVGGIQNYLWELWRRLPPESFAVLTTAHPEAAAFDAAQPFRVVRVPRRVLLPTPALRRRIDALAHDLGARFVVVDPVWPLGALGRRLSCPYVVMGHGAEVTVPGRIAGSHGPLSRVLRSQVGTVAGGDYVASELRRAAGRDVDMCLVPPGVDTDRFHPLSPQERTEARRRFGLPADGPLVVSVGRLVPRKGADLLIGAAARLKAGYPDLTVAVAGTGRDRARLGRLAVSKAAPVRFLGKVAVQDLPALYACADVFAAPNRTRWGGLEQEGFGIVYLEAAACGVPQVGGASGGVPEAVADGETGLLVSRHPGAREVAGAISRLLGDPLLRERLGRNARERALSLFTYPVLAARLGDYLDGIAESLAAAAPAERHRER